MRRPTLSLVIPVFNEEEVIPELHRRLLGVLSGLSDLELSWEVIFVDDGSTDGSPRMLAELADAEPRFKVLSFARNFGHQLAITGGLDRAEGDAVVVMDADLQDPPEVVREMIAKWREGFDVVYGVRTDHGGASLFKRVTAAAFYRILQRMLGGASIPADAGDFRLISRPVVLALRALRERHRFVRGMVAWVGFRQTAVHYRRDTRFAGDTKYPLHKMVQFALDGITSFSITPLRFATWLGMFSGLVSLLVALGALYVKVVADAAVPTWAIVVMVVALAASAQLLMIGILGEYVGRIYEEIKRRPLYVVAEERNFSEGDEATARSTPPSPPTLQ